MSRQILIPLVALLLMPLLAGSAMAVGTAADSFIYNGVFNSGDTVPQGAGELSIRYRKNATDSRYAFLTDGNTVAISVDTAYDLRAIYTPADSNAGPGETAFYVYWIENIGNAATWIHLDTQKLTPSDSHWGERNYRVLFDNGAAPGDSLITSDTKASWIVLAAGASRQVLLAVVIPDTAGADDTSTIAIKVSLDSATRVSATGDGWEAGVPIAGADGRDTQVDTVVTTVTGPNVKVAKRVTELTAGRSRPGDTLVFTIEFDNDGSDSAFGLQIVDAIPANTRFVPHSADSGSFLGNEGQTNALPGDSDIVIGLDTEAVGSSWTFDDSAATSGGAYDTTPITAIQWSLKSALGENNGDGKTATPDIAANGYDNGRVGFRVTIQ